MSYYIRTGNTYSVANENDIEVCETLPARVYTVAQNQMSGEFFLQPIDDFKIPSKLYGDTIKNAERIISTFEKRPLTTGVHMDGVKGSGKSLLAKYVSHIGKNKGYPTIVINQPYCGDGFNKFIQSIDIPAILLFDEFEKVYSSIDQQKILTLFDGVYPSKKLFLLTTNDSYMVSNYLKNRPGRIYYSLKFDTLDGNFVREYCEDNLVNKTHIDSIVNYTNIFSFFNFDMLSAVVEEMNRYNETLQQVLELLNITPETKTTDNHSVFFEFNGKVAEIAESYRGFNPNNLSYYVNKDWLTDKFTDDEIRKMESLMDLEYDIEFTHSDIHDFDPVTNTFVYRVSNGPVNAKIMFKKNKSMDQFNFNAAYF